MLTFEEFIYLPREEQNRRYVELSDHDKFLARINDHGYSSGAGTPGWKPTQEDLDMAYRIMKGQSDEKDSK